MKIKVARSHAVITHNNKIVDSVSFYSKKPHPKMPDKMMAVFLGTQEEEFHISFETIGEAKEYAEIFQGFIVYDIEENDVIK